MKLSAKLIEVRSIGNREIPYLCKPGTTVSLPEYPESKDGECLREIRVGADLSLRELAQRLGVKAVDLSDLERGRKTLRPNDWRTLFEALPNICGEPPKESA